tara:strand:+ start:620 stop:1339 length:720 start_codon:yes stop_codon:yes gene_type:complete
MKKRNKIIIITYIFLAIALPTSIISIDSTFDCNDFYTLSECEQTNNAKERPVIQFANVKYNESMIDKEMLEKISDKNKKIINDIYHELLLRPADQVGIVHWGTLLESELIDKEELRRQIYDSQEAIEKRLVSDPDLAIKIKFETLVNKAYFVVFEKHPDKKSLGYYAELLFFRVMGEQDLLDEFSSGEEICVVSTDLDKNEESTNEGLICTFNHPNPTVIPPGWDKASAHIKWATNAEP